MNGADRIAAERKRQIQQEGWDQKHDRKHQSHQLVLAAVCYALPRYLRERSIWGRSLWSLLWPWNSGWWKPAPSIVVTDRREERIRELEKAGALIAAEIDRLQAEAARKTTYAVVDAR